MNGIKIRYTRTGGAKPPMILLHGLMTNGLCWSDLASELEEGYDVIMPDARGHGESGAPEYGYSYEDHANDVVGLIEALRVPPPILLGHSMGGMTAAVVASRRPDLLRGVILVEPTFLTPKMQREVRDSDVADQHRAILKKSFEEIVADGRARHPERAARVLELFARARLQTSMAAFDVLTPPNPDFRKLIKGSGVSGLLVFGDKGIISLDLAHEIKRINQKFRIIKIEDAGHTVHLDQPEKFLVAVKAFLSSM